VPYQGPLEQLTSHDGKGESISCQIPRHERQLTAVRVQAPSTKLRAVDCRRSPACLPPTGYSVVGQFDDDDATGSEKGSRVEATAWLCLARRFPTSNRTQLGSLAFSEDRLSRCSGACDVSAPSATDGTSRTKRPVSRYGLDAFSDG
jgi:hypothetical protein